MLHAILFLAVALAIFAGAYYFARYTVRLETRNTALEDELNRATEHISKIEEYATQLQSEIEHMQRTAEVRSQRVDTPRAWTPGDPLNSAERT